MKPWPDPGVSHTSEARVAFEFIGIGLLITFAIALGAYSLLG